MKLVYPDYIKLVRAAYTKKMQNGELSPLLTTITRGNMRQLCLNEYRDRMQNAARKDKYVLEAFFGIPSEGESLESLIESFELDKFRQVEKVLKGKVRNPDGADIELLAWLIDFPHRPYGKEVYLNAEELAIIDGNSRKPDTPESEGEYLVEDEQISEKVLTKPSSPDAISQPEQPLDPLPITEYHQEFKSVGENRLRGRKKMLVRGLILLFALVGSGYFVWQREQNGQVVAGNSNTVCMYWTGDHYEETPCNLPQAGRLLLPFDKEKKEKFQRILRVDTITSWSVGKIYYMQNKGSYEFYTSGGMHPIETTRYLRKLTQTIYNSQFGQQSE